MQHKPFILIIGLSLYFLTKPLFAQQDTVTITYTEEAAYSSDFSLKEKYKYWTRANVEEKSMFKIGLPGFSSGGNYGLSIFYYFAYEQKVSIPFSFLVQYRHRTSGLTNSQSFGADIAMRYYYLLPKRVRQGKRANNLSSVYLSLQMNNTWVSFRDQNFINGSFNYSERKTTSSHTFSLLQGVQLRLGKYGYLDANLGPNFDPNHQQNRRKAVTLGFNFSIGVAF